MYYIYEIKNNINDKTYIGQHKTKNLNDSYMGSGVILSKAFEKYGLGNFSKKVIAICETKENANILEKIFIKLYREVGKAEYNISNGGDGGNQGDECNKRISKSLMGHPVSEETRNKISESHKGRVGSCKGKHLSEEHKRKISESHKGKKHKPLSEETRKKISEKLKNHSVSEETKRKISENTKLGMTDDVCKKISESNIKRFNNPENRKKLSESHKGKHLSEETRKKISEKLKGKKKNKRKFNNEF